MYLPMGDPATSFAIQVTVDVRDNLGGVRTYTLPTVTVRRRMAFPSSDLYEHFVTV